ncbi:MAG: hypothetical protein ACLRI7_13665 [Ruthenibacterium lactatiformans]
MTEHLKEMFFNISAASIDNYLCLKGWEREFDFPNPNLMVFNLKKAKKRIAIPASEKFEDFYVNLEETLHLLASMENITVQKVLKELSTVYYDKLEIRIKSKASEDGKLPLGYASSCIDGLKDLILYSVCAEQNAKPICFRATATAKDHLNRFKLGQTEIGSFIINVDIQVVNDKMQQLSFDNVQVDSPFEHKVVERIYTAVSQIDSIVKQEEKISVMAETAFEKGMTANMCEALLKMKPEDGETEIDTTIRFASAVTKKINDGKKIVLRNNHFWAMDELAKIYHDKIVFEDATLRGVVQSLTKKGREDVEERRIKLYTIYENKPRQIYIDLSEENYKIACDAHRDGLEVEVSGTLDKSERTWHFENVQNFRKIE